MTFMQRAAGPLVQWLVLLLALLVCWFDPGGVIDQLQRSIFDEYQQLAPRTYQDTSVRIVDIDDASLKEVGQWPWPRTAIAAMIGRLAASGAAAIALDIVFAEPDRTSPAQILNIWSAEGAPVDALRKPLAVVPDHDAVLTKAIRDAGNVVPGFALTTTEGGRTPVLKTGFATLGDDPRPFLPDYSGVANNLPAIEAAGAGNGSIAFISDSDFILRRVPLIERVGQQLYPTLSAEALRVALGAHTILVKATGASGEYGFGNQRGIVAIRIGHVVIPTDSQGRILIHYTPPAAKRVIPAWQVFADDFDPARVRGRIVLIGTSAAGLRDIRPSPIDPVMPGVEAHAQALEQMMLGHYLQRPDWAHAAEFCFVLTVGILLILLLRPLGAIWSGAVGAAAIFAAFAGSWYAYRHSLMLFDPVTPSIAAFLIYLSATITGYLRTESERQQIRGAFSQYLSPALVNELARNPSRLKLGGDLREMSFLFCDIRGFTTISEKFKSDPQALTQLLNRFLTPMTDAILARRGTVDKYIGDAVMAFWNAPLDDAEHAKNACSSALAMVVRLKELNAALSADARIAHRLFEPLRIGVGINTGNCVVGNMGSDQRFDYSVIGDAVNLASRLEGQSKTYKADIIISENTFLQLPGWAAVEIDLIAVMGKREAIRIYALLGDAAAGKSDSFTHLRTGHDTMIRAYRERRWQDALDAIARCRPREPRLGGCYDLYVTRIEQFKTDPPPPDWQGITEARSK